MPITRSITDIWADKAPLDSRTQDAKQPALYLVVSPKGKRSWEVYFHRPGHKSPLRRVIGRAGDGFMTVKEARAAAEALKVEAGKPSTAQATGKSPTFADVVDAFGAPWVKAEFQKYLEDWRTLRLNAITQDMVVRMEASILTVAGEESRRRDINAGKEPRANAGVHSVTVASKAIRTAYKIAAAKKMYVGENMGLHMTVTPVEPRLRVLTKAEEARFLTALDSGTLQPWTRPFFLLLRATGVRWGNCISARFEEFDLDAMPRPVWVIPAAKSKNGRPMRIVLSKEAVAIVKERQDVREDDCPWLFPNVQNPRRHLGDITWQWKAVKGLADLKGITPHDIRRSFGSKLISRGVSLDIVSSMMGHKSSATTQKYYAHVDDDAKGRALALLE